MSKIYITQGEDGIVISDRPPRPPEPERMEKEELIAFITRLKETCRAEDLPVDIQIYGMFNRYCHDVREDRIEKLAVIERCDPADAYHRLTEGRNAAPFSRQLREMRELCGRPISYREDLYEALFENGLSEEDAEKFTRLICGGQYKSFCRGVPATMTLEKRLPAFHAIGKGLKYLPARRSLTRLFDAEFDRFARRGAPLPAPVGIPPGSRVRAVRYPGGGDMKRFGCLEKTVVGVSEGELILAGSRTARPNFRAWYAVRGALGIRDGVLYADSPGFVLQIPAPLDRAELYGILVGRYPPWLPRASADLCRDAVRRILALSPSDAGQPISPE